MLEDAFRYPFRGDPIRRTAVGSLLVLGSVFVLPALVLAGYGVRVLETTLEGEEGPPAFDSWSELAATGVGAVAISLVYLLGPLVVGGVLGVILGGVGYYGLQTVAPVLAGSEALVWGTSLVVALLTGVVLLAGTAVTFAIYYAFPAGMLNYARTGRFRAAFDRNALWPVVTSGEYLLAMAVLQLLPLAAPVLVVAAAITVVGVVFVPAIPFVAAVVCLRLLAVAAVPASTGDRSVEPAPIGGRASRPG
ncbi:DUF4013 domain-containing protein [Natrialba swarupiae]|uniref:DUF4013 domain-containing protein n=1 Tax=Natrialba swarupiae TaxID=2448032 RepID=A0A5D5AUY2_9EURY|nr:DUF4013 domain-containing protein [Natrialba swarupiae]TYT62901.1 DUF4013 domain-containing protein [Natrialba swarupiae]